MKRTYRTIKLKEVCKSCNGTGLYVGMAERDGAAVVCYKCKGTGCYEYSHEYEIFSERADCPSVKRVFEVNPGIVIGKNEKFDIDLDYFGGIPVEDWTSGKPFPTGSEDRNFTCPKWWFQTADYKKCPDWSECQSNIGRSFSQCQYFPQKHLCWLRYDKENAK